MATSSRRQPFESHATFGEFISSDPELLLFRRFNLLNARALLYMQSELTCLEARLLEFDREDVLDGSEDAMLSARCFEYTLSRAAKDDAREVERLELIKQIQELTYRYNKMLGAQHQVQHMSSPKRRVWEVFRNWVKQAKPLIGKSQNLAKKGEGDFVAIGAVGDHDLLTRVVEYLTGRVIAMKMRSQASKGAPAYYAPRIVTRIITCLGIIGATLLLEAAIVGLYLVTNDRIRFVLIAVFIALFAAAISLLSNARRAEMFAATAAYAAVLVVFVSGNLTSGGAKT